MFSSIKLKIILGIYIFLIISVPVGAYLASEQTNLKPKAKETKPVTTAKSSPSPIGTPLPKLSQTDESDETSATSFGPTLSLKVAFEGRVKGNQSGKLFVGILEGTISINPKFLLSFTIDLPTSGEYSDLSLAGLNPGTTYSALLKGSAQIATSSAFLMSPTVTNLNGGGTINLLSGDLNEDNVINSSDYSIIQKALGSTSKSSSWLENADINKDGVINIVDLAILNKNFGKIGASGAWTSPLPTATSSASLNDSQVGSTGGYWLWVPGF